MVDHQMNYKKLAGVLAIFAGITTVFFLLMSFNLGVMLTLSVMYMLPLGSLFLWMIFCMIIEGLAELWRWLHDR